MCFLSIIFKIGIADKIVDIDKDNTEKKLKKLSKKLKDKKVIIYGAGTFFQEINKNFNLNEMFNIIGISDMKFQLCCEGEKYLGYNIIPKDRIEAYNPDYVLVGALEYWGIIGNFVATTDKKSKTTIMPLVDKSLTEIIKNNIIF